MVFFARSIKYQIKQEYSGQFPKDVSEIEFVTFLGKPSRAVLPSVVIVASDLFRTEKKTTVDLERCKSVETYLELAENLLQ